MEKLLLFMKKVFYVIRDNWYYVIIFSLVFNLGVILFYNESNLNDHFEAFFTYLNILILLILLALFGYHLYIKKWLKAFFIFVSSITHSFISFIVFIGIIIMSIAKSCDPPRKYDDFHSIDLKENAICAKMKDSLLVYEWKFHNSLEIGIAKDSVFGFHFDMGPGYTLPLCVGVYKLDDGQILTVEEEGLVASLEKDTLDLENDNKLKQ